MLIETEPEEDSSENEEPEKDNEPEKDSEVESIAFSNIPATIEGDEFCDMLS
jgi:hypothetical protein